LRNYDRNVAKKQAAKEEKRQKKLHNRHVALIVAGVTFLVIVAVLIVASLPHYVSITTTEDGRYYDTDTGLYYLAAPSNYEPVSYSAHKPYGKGEGHIFYPITGQDTTKWLTQDVYGICGVYYQEDVTLPTLDVFKPSAVRVCVDGEKVAMVVEIQDASDVKTVVDTMLNGEAVTLPSTSTGVYTLRVVSSEYTWLYYNIVFVVTEEGNFYYDRGTQKAVAAGTLVEDYIINAVKEYDTDMNTDSDTVPSTDTATEAASA